MSNREFASLACKILGIYLIIQGINVIANVLSVSFISFNQLEEGVSIGIFLPYTVIIILGILLWILSNKLSQYIVKEETKPNSNAGINASEIQSIAFSVIGLLFVGTSMPKVLSTLTNIYIMREAPYRMQLLPGLVGAITQLVLGVWVLLGSKRLVYLLTRLKYAGIKRVDSFED